MKINNQENNIELIGDIKEFKTGIDPKNLEFITTLLSSNLYSAPERSFIREIVSNAWDSHVEAGTTDVPVLVRIGKDSVTIRDFGTGLSPERFEEVYCNIGSSTKRESNDYIGGFGIGKFASLAVSNTVEIISYYEGKAYHYMMIKDGNRITNNLITVLDTEEKNGVSVTVNGLHDMNKYYNALSYIVFFPNVYVNGDNKAEADVLNNTKIKHFKNFAFASNVINHKLLIGNVLYPLDTSIVNNELWSFINNIKNTGVVIRFNIGEIEVTPNRENIIYSENTIKLINNRIKEACEEITAQVQSNFKKDYDNIIEWANSMQYRLYYDFFDNSCETCTKVFHTYKYIFDSSSIIESVTYKGQKLSLKIASVLRNILNSRNPSLRAVIDEKLYQNVIKLPYKVAYLGNYSNDKVLLIPSKQRLLTTIKEFLKEKYDMYAIVHELSFQDFLDHIYKTGYLTSQDINLESFGKVIPDLYDALMDRVKTIDFSSDADYIKLKEGLKAGKGKIAPIKNFYLYVWKGYNHDSNSYAYVRKNTYSYKTIDQAIESIKNMHTGVVLDNLDPTNEEFANIICSKKYYYITASKQVITELKKLNLSNIVDKHTMLNHDRDFVKLASISKYFAFVGLPPVILSTVPSSVREDFIKVNKYYTRFSKWSRLMVYVRTLNVPEDTYYKDLACKMNTYNELFSNIRKEYGISNYSELAFPLTVALIIKTKAYRVSTEAYNIVKTNKILNALWRKSLKQAV